MKGFVEFLRGEPSSKKYIAVVEVATQKLVYQGRDELKAATALEPGTVIGYSLLSQKDAVERAKDWARDIAKRNELWRAENG